VRNLAVDIFKIVYPRAADNDLVSQRCASWDRKGNKHNKSHFHYKTWRFVLSNGTAGAD
jgi:hypothetical protein